MFKHSFPAFVYAVLLFFSLSYSLPCFASLSPKVIHLIEVSSIQKNQLMVSWLPTTDDKTLSENLLYSVYVSDKADFQPNRNILKAKKIGASSAIIKGLQPDKTYFVLVTATDSDGNVIYSLVKRHRLTTNFSRVFHNGFCQQIRQNVPSKRNNLFLIR